MRKPLLLTLLVIGLVMAVGNNTHSNFPRLIQYQAVLTDSTGTPLTDTTVSVQFELFDLSAGGVSLWNESSNFSLVNGLLNHHLGSIVALPDMLFTDHDSLWLELTVDTEALVPRVLLTPSAYSIRVATIDQATGGDVFGDVQIHSDLLVGDHLGSTGKILVYDGNGPRITMLGAEAAGEASLLALSSINSQHVIELDAEDSTRIAHIRMYHKADLTLDAAAAQEDTLGSQIRMMTHAGLQTIEINAEYPGSGSRTGPDGRGEGRIGVNARPDSGTVHVESSHKVAGYFTSTNDGSGVLPRVLYAKYEGNTTGSVVGTWSEAHPRDGDGTGGIFIGGEDGIVATAKGGSANFGCIGVLAQSEGSAGVGTRYAVLAQADGGETNYGIFASATGGTNNWSGWFSGKAYASTMAVSTTNIPGGYALAVGGKALCEEIEVMLVADWPDYVFEENYDLMSLPEVEQSIKENGHLPGVPSAAEVAEGGIALGSFQATLLEKVEEMTLHMIEVNKSLEEIRQENDALKARLAAVEGGK